MKKIALFFATIAAVAGFTACCEDDGPVLNAPTEFKLNTPPFANQLYQLSDDGKIEITCSQPDYGVGVQTTYSVEMALNESFTDTRALTVADPSSATITLSASEINLAILDLLGVVDDATWEPHAANPMTRLYLRATAQAGSAEFSKITSNAVCLNNVQYYFAIKMPGFIYLVGNPEGWAGPTEDKADHYSEWRLFENEAAIGSKVYTGIFNMPAAPMFRFYTALTGWDTDSYGYKEADEATDFDMPANGVFESAIVKGKGSFNFPNFPGGEMTITVDLNAMTVKVQAGAVEVKPTTYVYMVGNNGGWAEPNAAAAATYEPWRVACSDGSGVYTNTFNLAELPDDDLYSRFYQELTGWGAAQWASTTDANFEVTSGQTVDTKSGEGCFMLKGAKGRNVKVDLDTNNNKVTFTFVD